MLKLELPIDEKLIRSLNIGDQVLITGTIVTARDAAHKLMIEEKPDFVRNDLKNNMIYHCGPIVRKVKDGYEMVACGPTTSIREEPYEADVIDNYKVRGVIGKGGMGPKTLAGLKKTGAVYIHAVGGAAVSLSKCVEKIEKVYLLEKLGVPEAFWVCKVKDFPGIVTMDSKGRSLHDKVEKESGEKLRELLDAGC
ncbi:MAG: FumA C-terminus/TtdB family hydratase beta subunit [Pseudomonadota bacterium]